MKMYTKMIPNQVATTNLENTMWRFREYKVKVCVIFLGSDAMHNRMRIANEGGVSHAALFMFTKSKFTKNLAYKLAK